MKKFNYLLSVFCLPLLLSSTAPTSYIDKLEKYDRLEIKKLVVDEKDSTKGTLTLKNIGEYFVEPDSEEFALYNKSTKINTLKIKDEDFYLAPNEEKTFEVTIKKDAEIKLDEVTTIETTAFKYNKDDENDYYYNPSNIEINVTHYGVEQTEFKAYIPTKENKSNTNFKFITLDIEIKNKESGEISYSNTVLSTASDIKGEKEQITASFKVEQRLNEIEEISIKSYSIYVEKQRITIDLSKYKDALLIGLGIALGLVFLLMILLIVVANKRKKKHQTKISSTSKNTEVKSEEKPIKIEKPKKEKIDDSFDEESLKDDDALDEVEFEESNEEKKVYREEEEEETPKVVITENETEEPLKEATLEESVVEGEIVEEKEEITSENEETQEENIDSDEEKLTQEDHQE